MMEIEWTDIDPETGQKRFVRASKFAREWQFRFASGGARTGNPFRR